MQFDTAELKHRKSISLPTIFEGVSKRNTKNLKEFANVSENT